ncbi:MAG: SPOR domain-containing protein [Stenotrophobium sp.]
MDEPLKRRLIGVCALLLLALLVSLVLPSPGVPVADGDGLKHVTLDLSQPPGAAAPAAAQPSSPMPPVIAAPPPRAVDGTVAEDDGAPQFDSPAGHDSVADSPDIPAQQAQSHAPQKPQAAAANPVPTAASKVAKPVPPATSSEVAKPATVKPNPPPAAPAVATRSRAQQDNWFIQAGVFSDIDNARHLAERLKGGGYAAIISPAETQAGVAYRVKSGPYNSHEQAEAAQQGLPKIGIAHSIILNP